MNQLSLSKRKQIDVFWGELSACDHTVQIYEDDAAFLDALEGFVAAGIRQGDAIILIATPAHLAGLEMRLESSGYDVGAAIVRDQYIAFDAKRALSKFMVDGWPDEVLFEKFVDGLLVRAKGSHRKVRAFGEMVALMWAEGQCGATVRLEHLWTRLVHQKSFSLFCAYPKSGFTEDAQRRDRPGLRGALAPLRRLRSVPRHRYRHRSLHGRSLVPQTCLGGLFFPLPFHSS